MLDKHDYEMITDLMNAIKITKCESWVKNFDDKNYGFMFSFSEPNVVNIYKHMKYDGHSGSSFASTMRYCQYYISNSEEWIMELDNYNIPHPH
jgi:hypothetical protein